MRPVCELIDVERTYGTGPQTVRALAGVDLVIEPGEFTVLSGPSGSGKSTLLNLLGCLDRPTRGAVRVEGREVSLLPDGELTALRARRIGFVFQSFHLVPVLTALENVVLALDLASVSGDRRDLAAVALGAVGLGDHLHRRPWELSGGQQQRVAIARALAKAPALVIADEPTANLDSTNAQGVVDLMLEQNRTRGATFLFSTHDPLILRQASRVVRLRDGRILDAVEVAP